MAKKIFYSILIVAMLVSVWAGQRAEASDNDRESNMPMVSPVQTATPIPADASKLINTSTAMHRPTNTPTPTSVPTNTPKPTNTPTSTPTPTNTPTSTPTPTPTNTPTPTGTPTNTPTSTNTPTPRVFYEANVAMFEQPKTIYSVYPIGVYSSPYEDAVYLGAAELGVPYTALGSFGNSYYIEINGTKGLAQMLYFQDHPCVTVNDVNLDVPKLASYSKVILFGDSRFALMRDRSGEGQNFVAKIDAGYAWMQENLWDVYQKYTDDSIILIEFGVNDVWNVDAYIASANALARAGYHVAYLTLLPVIDEKSAAWGYGARNNQCVEFNQKLSQGLDPNIIILDGYSYFMANGFDSYDGLHYSFLTNDILYSYIIKSLRR